MRRFAIRVESLAVAALAIAPGSVVAQDEVAQPPELIEFEGKRELTIAAVRQRILSQTLGYTVLVDEQGRAVDCELHRDFRLKVTRVALCRPLLKHLKFRPARDALGNPVRGHYSGEMNFRMWISEKGNTKPDRDSN